MSRISLCVIVKDEEVMLPGCLDAAREWVDEMVVCDTGSSDGTVALAEARGARVVHHPWRHDFADARNAALAHATGRWVLVLDADERLAPGAGAALRAAARVGDFDCGMMPLHNAARLDAAPAEVLSGRAREGEPQLLPRFLRRTPDLAWNGMIHESVTDWVIRGDRRVKALPAHIVHYGAVPSYREQRNKSARNIGLLERRAAEEPANPTPRSYLAYECLKAGDEARSRLEIDRAWEILAETRRAGGVRHAVAPIANLKAHLQIKKGDIAGALHTLDLARAWNPPHPNLDLLRGVAHEQRAANDPGSPTAPADLAEAEAAYRRCLTYHGQIFSDEVNPGATSWTAQIRLGTVLLVRGAPTPALAAFDAALADRPDTLEALLGRAEALLDTHHPRDALAALEPALKDPPAEEAPPPMPGSSRRPRPRPSAGSPCTTSCSSRPPNAAEAGCWPPTGASACGCCWPPMACVTACRWPAPVCSGTWAPSSTACP